MRLGHSELLIAIVLDQRTPLAMSLETIMGPLQGKPSQIVRIMSKTFSHPENIQPVIPHLVKSILGWPGCNTLTAL